MYSRSKNEALHLKEVATLPMSYLVYPKIDKSKIKLLWYCEYQDGPFPGILEYQEKRYWFDCCDNFLDYPEMVAKWEEFEDIEWYRRYTIRELSPEELGKEEKYHVLFCIYTEAHTDYDPDEIPIIGPVHPQSEHHKLYDEAAKRASRDYSNNKIIGWFEL